MKISRLSKFVEVKSKANDAYGSKFQTVYNLIWYKHEYKTKI